MQQYLMNIIDPQVSPRKPVLSGRCEFRLYSVNSNFLPDSGLDSKASETSSLQASLVIISIQNISCENVLVSPSKFSFRSPSCALFLGGGGTTDGNGMCVHFYPLPPAQRLGQPVELVSTAASGSRVRLTRYLLSSFRCLISCHSGRREVQYKVCRHKPFI